MSSEAVLKAVGKRLFFEHLPRKIPRSLLRELEPVLKTAEATTRELQRILSQRLSDPKEEQQQ